MNRIWRLWLALGLVLVASFAVLLFYGRELALKAPPIPGRVVTDSGQLLLTHDDILDGQNVWQSIGGMQLGSIWGHGSYIAPDWSADWLHRECLWLLERWSQQHYRRPYRELEPAQQAILQHEMRCNRYDADRDTLTISDDRAQAFRALSIYYACIFGQAETFPEEIAFLADGRRFPAALREAYAMPPNTVADPERMRKLCAFIFWTAWACVAERPHSQEILHGPTQTTLSSGVSYTNNWPAEPLVNNRPTGQA